jgi:hypothetical protein
MSNQAAIPWYSSPVQLAQITTAISTLVALAPGIASRFGLTSPQAVQDAVQSIAGVVALIAVSYAGIKRARSTIQPLTLTQAGADVHPNTVAANAQAVAIHAAIPGDVRAVTQPLPIPTNTIRNSVT